MTDLEHELLDSVTADALLVIQKLRRDFDALKIADAEKTAALTEIMRIGDDCDLGCPPSGCGCGHTAAETARTILKGIDS